MTSVAASSSRGAAEAERRRQSSVQERGLLNELLLASGHRDEAAFARFYQLTSPWIYYLLRRRTASTSHAEDAMVLVYGRIWHEAVSFAPTDQSPLVWVTTIAHDVVGDDIDRCSAAADRGRARR